MQFDTLAKTLPVHADQAYAYLADIRNLPDWAIHFCKTLESDRGESWIQTPQGRMLVRLAGNPDSRTIDFELGPDPEHLSTWPSRVVELPDNRSVFLFTAVRADGISEEKFEGQTHSLREELDLLARNLSRRSTLEAPTPEKSSSRP